jgi:hypothetical protein
MQAEQQSTAGFLTGLAGCTKPRDCVCCRSAITGAGSVSRSVGRVTEVMRKWPRTLIATAIIAALAFAVDHYRKSTQPSAIDPCIANLIQIRGATENWVSMHHKTTNDIPTWPDVLAYFGSQPTCYRGGTYSLAPVGQKPTCTIPGHSL